MKPKAPLAIRWTIGDVSDAGFEALRCSAWGAYQVFGEQALYTVCVNSVPLEDARARAGEVPGVVTWRMADPALPSFLRQVVDSGMAEGVAWKFAPLRLFPDCYELSLDNDCILWGLPPAIDHWLLADEPSFLLAEDVRPCFGRFEALCGAAPRNSGIRGLPPGFDLERALGRILARCSEALVSELDEQGLQVATLLNSGPTYVVSVDDVAICSPFPPHIPHLGRSGAHFVGLNARRLPWSYAGRPAEEWTLEHWRKHRPAVLTHVGLTS